MKKNLLFIATGILLSLSAHTQQLHWSDDDRKYLLNELTRSREALLSETNNLSAEQWNFKESPDRWSIAQIVEHIATWEVLFQREISQAIAGGPAPDTQVAARADSTTLRFIMEEHPHTTTDYTKPFTFSVPMGLNEGKNNIRWFVKLRDESLKYVGTTSDDQRSYYLKAGRPNIHQIYISTFGHTDRHVRQIKKIKAHAKYPR